MLQGKKILFSFKGSKTAMSLDRNAEQRHGLLAKDCMALEAAERFETWGRAHRLSYFLYSYSPVIIFRRSFAQRNFFAWLSLAC